MGRSIVIRVRWVADGAVWEVIRQVAIGRSESRCYFSHVAPVWGTQEQTDWLMGQEACTFSFVFILPNLGEGAWEERAEHMRPGRQQLTQGNPSVGTNRESDRPAFKSQLAVSCRT